MGPKLRRRPADFGQRDAMRKITNLRIKLRIQESAHVRAWVSGDTEKAAEHRRKIKQLKAELDQLTARAA
jgi:hypothetical protein